MSAGLSGYPRSSKDVVNSLARADRGGLLLEAVLAAFLMIFAFATSASLFDASLRWESEATNIRRASLVAERRLEELRALTAKVPAGSSFSNVLAGHLGVETEYPEDPGFQVKVKALRNRHDRVETSGLTPPDGVHSPCSALFTAPPATSPGSNPPNDNPQLNNAYSTYPYSRSMPTSLRLVEVTVTYSGGKTLRLVSLLGDPIVPFAKKPVVVVTKASGPSSLSNTSTPAVFEAQVVTQSNSRPDDVTVLWSTTLDSTGALDCLPLDSTGRTVRVTRAPITPSGVGAKARVQALVRYGGQEAVGESIEISLP